MMSLASFRLNLSEKLCRTQTNLYLNHSYCIVFSFFRKNTFQNRVRLADLRHFQPIKQQNDMAQRTLFKCGANYPTNILNSMGGMFRSCGCGGSSSKPYSPYGYAEGPVPIYAQPAPAPIAQQTTTTYTSPGPAFVEAPPIYAPPPPPAPIYTAPPPPPPSYTTQAVSTTNFGPPPPPLGPPPSFAPPPGFGPGGPIGGPGPAVGGFGGAGGYNVNTALPPPQAVQSQYYHQANIIPGAPPPGPFNTTPPVIKY